MPRTRSDQATEDLLTVLLTLVRLIVDDTDAVKVSPHTNEDKIVFKLEVAPSDRDKVIGEHGRTVGSLRTVLSTLSMKYSVEFALDIDDLARR